MAEALGVIATALAPLGPADARTLIESVPGLPAIASDEASAQLTAILGALSAVVTDHPEIMAADINPVVLGPAGATAVDALIAVADAGPACDPRAGASPELRDTPQ